MSVKTKIFDFRLIVLLKVCFYLDVLIFLLGLEPEHGQGAVF